MTHQQQILKILGIEEIARNKQFLFSHNVLIEWCLTPLATVFQSYHGDSSIIHVFWVSTVLGSHYSCLSWVLPVLGWGSKVSCPRTPPQKTSQDPVWLEPRTPGLRVKHFTTEPHRLQKVSLCGNGLKLMKMTESHQKRVENTGKRKNCQFSFSHSVFKRLVLQTCQNQGLYGKGLRNIVGEKMVVSSIFSFAHVFKCL